MSCRRRMEPPVGHPRLASEKDDALMVRPAACRTELDMALPARRMGLMHLLLGVGILYDTPAGITVSRFLHQALGAGAVYLENRIQTLFMNGRAVDCPDATIIQSDCTLALSAAMPGVFGAAFRRQGAYSGLRRRREAEEVPGSCTGAAGGGGNGGQHATVTLKCFNQVAADLGDALLLQGVSLSMADFLQFWLRHGAILGEECESVRVDRSVVDPWHLSERLQQKSGPVRLTLSLSMRVQRAGSTQFGV